MDGDRMKTIPFLYVDEKHILFYEEIEEEECVAINFLFIGRILGVYVHIEIYFIMKYEYTENGNNMVGKNTTCYPPLKLVHNL